MLAPGGSHHPIFILSHARTGSTLLRYVVDAHPQVCCPPELALGRLCRDLSYTLALTLGDESMGLGESAEANSVRAAVRDHVDRIMDTYCATKGKDCWCDKSTNNVEYLALIDRIFPDARYVCLHRECLDVVHSLLELFRFGFTGRYAQAVARSPENTVGAMIDTWIHATDSVLDFEAAHQQRCFRVKYEELVAHPESIAGQMFSFLQLPFTSAMLDRVFTVAHDPGPGDLKIQFTSHFDADRTGAGARIPRTMIPDDRLAAINRLHASLGYAPVTRQAVPRLEVALKTGRVSRAAARGTWG